MFLPIALLRIVVRVVVLHTCSVYSSAWSTAAVPRLHEVTLPATSDPVERIFSCGGMFMRPHKQVTTEQQV